MEAEEPLLKNTSQNPSELRVVSRHPLFVVLAGAALVGLGAIVDRHDVEVSVAPSAPANFAHTIPKLDHSSELTSITASNSNLETYGTEGGDYPWMDGLLVEPYMETTFVSNGESKSWTISKVDGDTGSVLETLKEVEAATSVVHTFTEVGKYIVTADDESGTVHTRYVRREIRSLTNGAREKLFSAWSKVIEIKDEALGKAQYGDSFTMITKLAALHNNWAGAQDCDHLHDGTGFLTTHVQVGRLFEASLQSVDPSVSLPYWEYTIDVEDIIENKNGNFQFWKDLDVFSDEYFGRTNPDTATIDTGFLAKMDAKADSTYSEVTNAYGLLRSPWNNLHVKKPVRYQGAGGASQSRVVASMVPNSDSMPTCSNLLQVLEASTTFSIFSYKIAQQAHGPVHLVTGGVGGTPEFLKFVIDTLGVAVHAPEFSDAWNVASFFQVMNRATYRYKLLDVPTTEECAQAIEEEGLETPKCLATCDPKKVMASGVYSKVMPMYGYSDAFSDEQIFTMLDYMCKGKTVFGDHGSSSAVLDPSFFSIHGAVERYLQLQRLKGRFTDESWPAREDCLYTENIHPFQERCAGHYEDDELLFGEVDGQTFNNYAYYKYLDPRKAEGTYVYDNFRFPHCEKLGYKINY